jgi:hypothetical protein
VDGILSQIEQQDRENGSPGEWHPWLVQQAIPATGKSQGHNHRAGPVEPHVNEGANNQQQGMHAPLWSCGQRVGWYSSEARVRRSDQIMPKGACAQRKY